MRELTKRRDAWLQDPNNAEHMRQSRIANILPNQHKAAEAIAQKHMGWCPPEYRDTYRFFTKVKRYKAAEARALVEDMVATDKARTAESVASRISASHDRMKRGGGHNVTAARVGS